ncbi:MAG: elongation factor Ts [Candidatus Nomurabacteria bacterium]|jgi:elongation factor Ts|nr:elongation factor Ts [Candidatus Nomurabacteria bacterium]
MAVSLDDVKKLKELTGVGLTDAKRALEEADGDFDKALTVMREKGMTKAEKRGEREAREGLIDAYVHSGRIGVLVELNCETDFVAKTAEFKALAHDLAMQIAAMSPKWINSADIPAEEIDRKKAELLEAAKSDEKNSKKPADVLEKIIQGQMDKYFDELVLMNQIFWKDGETKVSELVKQHIAKLGENVVVRQMKRIELGVTE